MDLIYREDLLKNIENAKKVIDKISNGIVNDAATITLETVRKIVDLLPAAQPERKTGKWIERNPQNSPDCRLIECSECGNAYIVGYNIDYDDWIDGRNFCMKCGADLRGGGNGKST